MHLIDYNEICKDLPKIESSKILKKNKRQFHEKGLFSEQIFGPLKNYTCQCGIYHGSFRSGGICKFCGVPITKAEERRKRFAAIKLPLPVYNPIMIELISNIAGTNFKQIIQALLTKKDAVLVVTEVNGEYDCEIGYINNLTLNKNSKVYKSYEAIDTLIYSYVHATEDKKWDIVKKNYKLIKNNYVLVIPPDLRPSLQVAKDKIVIDDINKCYVRILTLIDSINATSIIENNSDVEHKYFVSLQVEENKIFDFALQKISKKSGLIRSNILGKRVDFSGRAAIIPDPTLGFDECSLPYQMAAELFKINVAKEISKTSDMLTNEAIEFVEDNTRVFNEKVWQALQKVTKDKVCILNRQPSLHRLSMLGFKIKVNDGRGIKINPYVCTPIAGDFDGDTVAIYIPITKESQDEIKEKMLFSKNLVLPSTNKLCTYLTQDMVIGIYVLTAGWISSVKDCWNEFVSCFPSYYVKIKKEGLPITKSKLDKLLNIALDKCNTEDVVRTLDNLKKIGYKYSTIYGTTLSLDLITDMVDLREQIYSKEDADAQLQMLLDKKTDEKVFNNFPVSYMVKSGARGNIEQLKQLVLSRGFVSNFFGDIIQQPIKNSFVAGLTPKEFFNSTYGSRKGLLDVAINTGISGYLSRKIIFAGASLELDNCTEDCGTDKGLILTVENIKHAQSLIGRYMFNEDRSLTLINSDNVEKLVGKTIEVRSPMYCKNLKICKKCYGRAPRNLHSPYIGVIAAQSIGEINTQLVLRTFHTSGVAKRNEGSSNMKQQDIVGDLYRVGKLFHMKENIKASELVQELYKVYAKKKDILQVHFECIVSNMMWNGDKLWRLQNQNENYELVSILQVPIKQSWTAAIAFSHPKEHILKSIKNGSDSKYNSIIDDLVFGKKPEVV